MNKQNMIEELTHIQESLKTHSSVIRGIIKKMEKGDNDFSEIKKKQIKT